MYNKKIEIVHFCEKWGSGGLESFIMNIYRNIDYENIKFNIIVSQDKGSIFDDEIIKLGGNKRALLPNNSDNTLKRVIKNYIYFYNDLKKNKYNTIHFNACNGSVYICVLLAKLAGVSTRIMHSHTTNVGDKNRTIKIIYHKFCRMIFGGCATHYFACSQEAAKWMFPKRILKNNNVKIIKNAIEIEKFIYNDKKRQEIRSKLGIQDKFVLGNIGRLSKAKNQSFLIDIFDEIYKKNKDTVLIIIGNGELEKKLKEKAEKLNLDKSIIFTGSINNVSDYLQAMDVFIFPSLSEGLGIAAIEAQASGLKVFASDAIPKEAKVSNKFKYIPLTKTPYYWAQEVLSENYSDRDNTYEQLSKSGYDIKKVAKEIEKFYIEK